MDWSTFDVKKRCLLFCGICSGLELGRQIRNEKPLCILFAITGWAGLFEVEECREAGFDDFFIKPVQFDMLQKAVEDAFDRIERWRKR